MNNTSYTKLPTGNWGLRIVGEKPIFGQKLAVKTRAGKVKEEIVDTVVWSGEDRYSPGQTTHLCSILAKAPTAAGVKA